MPRDHTHYTPLLDMSSSAKAEEIPPTLCEMPRSGKVVEIRARRQVEAMAEAEAPGAEIPLKIRALQRKPHIASSQPGSPGQVDSAHRYAQTLDGLVQRRYSWRGYGVTDQQQEAVSLSMTEAGKTLATITVSVDGPRGLKLERTFRREVEARRANGAKLCEFSRLATEPELRSRRALAKLFHVAYVVAHDLMGADTLLIEVNPRHVSYYERMLGFKRCDASAQNQDVGAPAVLLELSLSFAAAQIVNGHTEVAMYRDFFSPDQARLLVERLKMQLSVS